MDESFCHIYYIYFRTKKNDKHKKTKTHTGKKIQHEKEQNLKIYIQFTLSVDLSKHYKTEITSFSPNHPNTSDEVEICDREKSVIEKDIKSLVKKRCTKHFTPFHQPTFRIQVCFQVISDKEGEKIDEVRESYF